MKAIIVLISEPESHSQDSEGGIRSKTRTESYAEGWDRVFGIKHPGTDFQHTAEDSTLCSICKDKANLN